MGDDNGCPCGDFCVHPSPPCSTALLIEQLRTRLAAVENERDRLRSERDEARRDMGRVAVAMGCDPADEDDLVEAVRLLVKERDAWKARAEAAEAERDIANRERMAVVDMLVKYKPGADTLAEAVQRMADRVADTRRATAEEIAAELYSLSNAATVLSHMTLRDYGLQDRTGEVRRAAAMLAMHIRAKWCGKEGK